MAAIGPSLLLGQDAPLAPQLFLYLDRRGMAAQCLACMISENCGCVDEMRHDELPSRTSYGGKIAAGVH